MKLKDKVALVTGSSRGIGRAIALNLAREGAKIIVNSNTSKGEVVEEIKAITDAIYISCDVSDEEQVKEMIKKGIETFGKIDILVNNAGIVSDMPFFKKTAEQWNKTLGVNLMGTVFCCKYVGMHMKENNLKGAIINISSMNGINTFHPDTMDYDISKEGVNLLTKDLAIELAPNVRVNAVAPGWVNTEMNADLSEDYIKSESEKIYVKRFGEPEEIAKIVAFLASDDASFITGSSSKLMVVGEDGVNNMADEIDYKIHGDDMQIVEIELDPQEGVRAEAGTMLFMEDGIQMQTNTGGVWKGFKRMLTGDGFFITTFSQTGKGKANVAFGAPYPGKIVPINLKEGEFLCQRDSFLCAAAGTEIDIAFTKRLGAGFFGGEGFILQKLQGDGLAFVHAGGTIIEKTLKAGETLRVDTGCIVGFSNQVDYNIQFVGGFRNALFGGEGLFVATLTGPGKVYLQSLPFSRLADRIMASARVQRRGERGLGESILGGVIGGDKGF